MVADSTLYVGFYFDGHYWCSFPKGLYQTIVCDAQEVGLLVSRIDGDWIIKGYEAHYYSMRDVLSAVAHSPNYFGLNARV